jgi:hypothetical protein
MFSQLVFLAVGYMFLTEKLDNSELWPKRVSRVTNPSG